MKRLLIFLFSLPIVLMSSAQTLDKTRVTLSMVNVTVEEFLDEVERQTKIEFLYKSDEVVNLPRITVHEKNAVTRQVISKVLAGIGCNFKENNGIVVVRLIKPRKDSHTVTGVVLDENKEPVIGAQVKIVGSQLMTVTDAEGTFSFSQPIPEKAQLQVSFVGLETTMLPVKSNMVVNMRSDTQTLEGVVVTGIFTRKKESFTGSATTIQAEELKMVGNQNILQSLKTLDPSFAIIENETFGSDPNRLPDVEVRGKTSIVGLTEENFVNPNQPLFILDGFESTLSTVNDLNMDRVESITILKDAAATAIYGSKAANGVIVVETKKPEPGRLRVNYFGNFSVTFADLSDYNLMNASEKLEFEKMSGYFGTLDENNQVTNESDQMRYNSTLAEINRGVDTYWLNEPLRVAFSQKHSLFLEGGSGDMLYGVGVGYGNTQGVMKGSDKDLLNGNVKLIYRKKRFSLANNLNLDYSKADRETVSFSRYARTNPYFRKYNEQGQPDMVLTAIDYKDMELLRITTKKFYNPLYDYEQNSYNQTNSHGFTNNLELSWMILDGLQARGKIGIGWTTEKGAIFRSPFLSDYVEMDRLNKGQYTESSNTRKNYNGEVALSYTKLLGEIHNVNAIVGL